ncbi:MAG TPA: O-antigen ligase family protein [Nocardioidaceae bacterium]
MSALLLVIATGWAAVARGGTAPRDVLVVGGLLAAAVLTGSRVRMRREVLVAVGALLVWMVLVTVLRAEVSFTTAHVPALVVLVVLASLAARSLDEQGRWMFLAGAVLIGVLQAAVALVGTGAALVRDTTVLPPEPRAAALLGSPNALGYLLVATGVVTAWVAVRAESVAVRRLAVAAGVLQAAAILTTGSRGALLVSVVVAAWLLWRSPVADALRRPGWLAGVVLVAGGAAAVTVARFAREGQDDRLELWGRAVQRILEEPLLGHGPEPVPYLLTAPGARPTTHAHNEVLQLTVEYGVVGLALAAGTAALVLWRRQPDPLLLAAGGALVAGGLLDFSLRITAVAVLTAVATTCALVPPQSVAGRHRGSARSLTSGPARVS